MKSIYRVCYKNGIEKKENERFEFYEVCDCENCIRRREHLKQLRNTLTITTDSKSKFEKVEEILKSWKCRDGNRQLETEYITI